MSTAVGDSVSEDEVVAEIETDKVRFLNFTERQGSHEKPEIRFFLRKSQEITVSDSDKLFSSLQS